MHSYTLTGGKGVPKALRDGIADYSKEDDFEFLSADLSAASDYIHHDLARAVWWGIVEATRDIKDMEDYISVGMACIGTQQTEIAGRVVKTSRGILMGLPLTWPILSLIQEFCAWRALSKVNQSSAIKRIPVAICGDDLVAAWTRRHTHVYHEELLAVGLVANKAKEYRSTRGAVFVEKLFRLRECTITEKIPLKSLRRETNNLWEWIKVRLPKSASVKRKFRFFKVHQVQRPLLSAVVQAKRSARNSSGKRNNQDVPQHFTLGPCISDESDKCSEPWRKAALMKFTRQIHARLIHSMENSGVPLYFPQSLGGWGFPGKQGAPLAFRKAAAVSVTGNTELVKRFSNIFLTSCAPNRLRKRLKAALKSIREWPERFDSTDKVQSKPVRDLQGEFVSRTLAFHAGDPTVSKLASRRYASVGSTAKRIRDTVYKLEKMWKSVKPIKATNAITLATRFDNRRVDGRYIDQLLMMNGVFDSMIKGYINAQEIDFALDYDMAVTVGWDANTGQEVKDILTDSQVDALNETLDEVEKNSQPKQVPQEEPSTENRKGVRQRDLELYTRYVALLRTKPRAIPDSRLKTIFEIATGLLEPQSIRQVENAKWRSGLPQRLKSWIKQFVLLVRVKKLTESEQLAMFGDIVTPN
jgi:hypothetical protein